MTERSSAADAAPLRLAVIYTDAGFLQVLTKRLERLAWEHRVLASAVPVDTVVAMRLNAIVVDLAVLGPPAWEYLEKLCAALPGLGVVVCTGQSTVAQRVRGLRLGADDWLTKPCHPEELIARIEAVVRRRDRDPLRSLPGLRAPGLDRPHAPRVRAHRAAGGRRGPRARARGDLPARLGLRDGPRRPLGRRLRAQAAPEAREGLARVALHPHALRRRLPLRAGVGARRGAGRGAGCSSRGCSGRGAGHRHV